MFHFSSNSNRKIACGWEVQLSLLPSLPSWRLGIINHNDQWLIKKIGDVKVGECSEEAGGGWGAWQDLLFAIQTVEGHAGVEIGIKDNKGGGKVDNWGEGEKDQGSWRMLHTHAARISTPRGLLSAPARLTTLLLSPPPMPTHTLCPCSSHAVIILWTTFATDSCILEFQFLKFKVLFQPGNDKVQSALVQHCRLQNSIKVTIKKFHIIQLVSIVVQFSM